MSTKPKPETEKRKPEKPDDPNRPPWLPPLDDWHSLPERQRRQAEKILVPMYTKLVAKVDDPLEQTVGMSIVQIAWMELLNCHEAAKISLGDLEDDDIPSGLATNRESWFKLHEKLTHRKLQAVDLLHKLRCHKQRAGAEQKCSHRRQTVGEADHALSGLPHALASVATERAEQNPDSRFPTPENQHRAEQNGPGHPETADSVDQNADRSPETPGVLTKNGPDDRRRAKQERRRQKSRHRRAKRRRR